jgi:hypothetical protein
MRKKQHYCSPACAVAFARSGEHHYKWKDWNDLCYASKHARVEHERGLAIRCIIYQCDTGCTTFEWANISHEYKDVGDFMPMCKTHHNQYDAERRPREPNAKLSYGLAEEIRARYDNGNGGISQRKLADEYATTQTNIGFIVRNETWQMAS